MTSVVDYALAYSDAGLSVIPVRTDGSKHPAGSWKKYKEKAMNHQEIKNTISPHIHGLGFVCGKSSGGLEIIDFDVRPQETYNNFKAMVDLLAPTLLARIVKVQTPSGGFHLYYRSDAIKGNQKLATTADPVKCPYTNKSKEVLIETRGSTGFVVAPGSPPSCHPSNKTYEWLEGDFNSIPNITAAERSVLIDTARSLNEKTEASKQTIPKPTSNSIIFNKDLNWKDILEPHGWTLSATNKEINYWMRPGKETGGASATTGYCGDRLHVFSSNASPFIVDKTYDKFSAFALLNYGGDEETAASDANTTKEEAKKSVFNVDKLLKKFIKYNQSVIFIEDEKENKRVFIKTGNQKDQSIEVKELLYKDAIYCELKRVLDSIGTRIYTTNPIKNLYSYIMICPDIFKKTKISYVSGPQTKLTYAYKVMSEVIPVDTRAELKNWNEWLDRISDPEAFSAWIWSIYEEKHEGRQLMYLWGEHGEDGKSRINAAIQKQFGIEHSFSITNNGMLSASDRFGTSFMVGKRFLYFPDTSNDNILKYHKVKSILGKDYLTIEPKTERAFSAMIDARLLACANTPLKLSSKNWEKSRLLLIKVEPPKAITTDFQAKLEKEYDKFLQYAKFCYEKLCKDHYKIQSTSSEKLIEDIVEETKDEDMVLIESYFDLEDLANGKRMEETKFEIKRSEFWATLPGSRNGKQMRQVKEIMAGLGYKDFSKSKGYQKAIGKMHVAIYRGVRKKIYIGIIGNDGTTNYNQERQNND